MTEPRELDVRTPDARLRALEWGAAGAPIALCLHGFPDTPHGWRKVAPLLVDAGWRVVAPFQRGYAPSSLSSEGSYHVGALMDDALRMLDAAGPTGRDVLIGHYWGGMAAAGIAALPDSPFVKTVVMSVPPTPAWQPRRGVGFSRSLAALMPAQLIRSWYIAYFQFPWLPERSASWVLPLLWRRWSPGYPAEEDLRHVQAAIGSPANWKAAVGYYRAAFSVAKPPERYADLQRHWAKAELVTPTLYLHGADDGCMTVKLADRVPAVLPDGSDFAAIERAGHFLQLEQPEAVANRILDFVGR
jgi:pimeloyl-ACP methyl ester carboxylesterase